MAYTRLPMRKVREVLRLHHECRLSGRDIARGCGIARSTVADYLWRAQQAGLAWPLPPDLGEEAVERLLFPPSPSPAEVPRALPDFQYLQDELRTHKRLNLTLDLLWREYREQHPDGYQYSRFCDLYRQWLGKRDYCMRQDHKAGEKLFVDYCDGLDLVDRATGELLKTHLFVAVWGASNFTYAEASLSQDLPSWIGAHARAFEHAGCTPQALVPDNLKAGVARACLYEPQINATYAEMAEHYGCAVLPARPYRPRDKAKVEAGVLVAQRWILAALRRRVFHDLAELNAAVRELLGRLNDRLLRKAKQSRRAIFESIDRPAARPLPERPYEYAEWRKAAVNIDYHVDVDGHYYSVPFRFLRETLDVRLTAGTVEVLRAGERIAAHPRSRQRHAHTTVKAHMPPEHQKHVEWTPSRIVGWAAKTGPATAALVERIMAAKTHPEQGYRACLGVLRLSKSYTPQRLEAAAGRALRFNTCTFRSIRSILVAGLDRQDEHRPASQGQLPLHGNVRGGDYYH